MFRNALIGGAATLLVVATAAEIRTPPQAKILYNPSHSSPIGYYRVGSKIALKPGDQIAFYAPDWARKMADERGYLPQDFPLIKTVLAGQGAEICKKDGVVSVPNFPDMAALLRDNLGRELPAWEGCYTLGKAEYFVGSVGTEEGLKYGFDSRYFGDVNEDLILGRVSYLGNGLSLNAWKSMGGQVGEGK